MEALVREFLPHAPQLGLYVAPDIPASKLEAAVGAFGSELRETPLALYDATRFGTGRSGILFGATRFCVQNLIETPQQVAYTDLIGTEARSSLLGGRRLGLSVNRGRATFALDLDFSAHPDALPYVERFLREAQAVTAERERAGEAASPDPARIEAALGLLEQARTFLTPEQRARLRRLGDEA